MQTDQEEIVKMKVKIYRNGDSLCHPATYSYNSSRIPDFKHLIDEIQNLPLFRYDGYSRITRLYTIDGRRIIDLYSFENSDLIDFVVTGPEGFMRIKGGYQNHVGYQSPTENHPEDPKPVQPVQYKEENTQQTSILQRPRSQLAIKAQPEDVSFDEVSYLSMNKLPRLSQDRIENRVDMGMVKRIYLYRNGDPFFKPKLYVYRSKLHKKWDKFLEEVEKMAPPIRGGGVRHLYTLKGREVTSFDQLSDKRGYVVSGSEGFLDVRGGYELIGRPGIRPSPTPVPVPEQLISSRPRTHNGRPKTGRSPGQSLLDRRLPEPTFFFVFKNGDGLEPKRFLFTPQQVEKGMSWIMEQVGRRFGIYANKLVTMDDREVTDPRQFINRGAYIVIPFGEKFTDSWHHFPEMAIDTSIFNRRDGSTSRSQSRSQSRYGNRPRTGFSRSHSRLSRSQSQNIIQSQGTNSARYDEGYGSGKEAFTEEDKKQQHHDINHLDGQNERKGSATSHCSLCDLLEQHRQQHQLQRSQSVEDINRTFLSRSQMFLPENPPLDNAHKNHLYSAEDMQNILPPRPATSRRIRLSPPELPDDNNYPIRSTSLPKIASIDDHGPVIHPVTNHIDLDQPRQPPGPSDSQLPDPMRPRSNTATVDHMSPQQSNLVDHNEFDKPPEPPKPPAHQPGHVSTMDDMFNLPQVNSNSAMVTSPHYISY